MVDYVLPHSIPQEDERLTLMSRMLDPQTFFRLEQLGVTQGWRCLEVGAGNGSVSLWLAETVGPEGHVVASDIDTRFLDRLSRPNLEVHQTSPLRANRRLTSIGASMPGRSRSWFSPASGPA